MNNKIKILVVLSAAVAVFSTPSCGGGSSNDQGTSFSLFGAFAPGTEDDDLCTAGTSGSIIALSSDFGDGNVLQSKIGLGLQNHTVSVIRVRRVLLNYFIEGATTQPPVTSLPIGVVLAPGSSNPNSSLPPTPGTGGGTGGESDIPAPGNIACAETLVVPPDIQAYLNFNRNSLPALPYTMHVEMRVAGITSAGDEIESNPLDYFVQVTEDTIINPIGGSGSSSSEAAIEESFDEDFNEEEFE